MPSEPTIGFASGIGGIKLVVVVVVAAVVAALDAAVGCGRKRG